MARQSALPNLVIGASGFSGAQLTVGPGSHHLAGSHPFGASIYGFAFADAYSYPAGISVPAPVGTNTLLSLSPANSSLLVGQPDGVTARLVDAGGMPLAGRTVNFQLTGVNPTSASAQTD